MAGNTFGTIFKLTSFGESHGVAIGGIIDGCPAGLSINIDQIQVDLDRRKPGQSHISTQRKESDTVEILSGIFEGKTLGTPIGFMIRNKDQRSKDYSKIKDVYRPSHADFTYQEKYGIRDYRGGGRSSARETACRVVAGSIAKQILKTKGIEVTAYVSQIGSIKTGKTYQELNLSLIEENIVRCPDADIANQMIALVEATKKKGDSLGGIIQCLIKNPIVGIGEPVFDRLNANLAKAMLSINAVKGFELGSGFTGAERLGSEHNDAFKMIDGVPVTETNNSGGIQGGISNGQDIYFNVAFKPVATIFKEQDTINKDGEKVKMRAEGRHDPCVVPRAVPIVEAMTAIVMLDALLLKQTNRLV